MLKLGSHGPEVTAWQAFLAQQGEEPGAADGRFGTRTAAATISWQLGHGLAGDAIVGPATYRRAYDLGFRVAGPYRLIPAAHFTPAMRGRGDVDLVVVHTTEGPELPRRSEATAAWLADSRSGGSCHYIVDPVQIVQCVLERDIAWGAGGANRRGIHIEHCGKAEQSAAEWADDASTAELALSSALCADICKRYGIPALWLSAQQVRNGARGITGHAECVAAFGGSHWDPGSGFPRDRYVELVLLAMDDLEVTPVERPTVLKGQN